MLPNKHEPSRNSSHTGRGYSLRKLRIISLALLDARLRAPSAWLAAVRIVRSASSAAI